MVGPFVAFRLRLSVIRSCNGFYILVFFFLPFFFLFPCLDGVIHITHDIIFLQSYFRVFSFYFLVFFFLGDRCLRRCRQLFIVIWAWIILKKMQLFNLNPFVNRVRIYEEDDSDEPPVLEIPPIILRQTTFGTPSRIFPGGIIYCRLFLNHGRVR